MNNIEYQIYQDFYKYLGWDRATSLAVKIGDLYEDYQYDAISEEEFQILLKKELKSVFNSNADVNFWINKINEIFGFEI